MLTKRRTVAACAVSSALALLGCPKKHRPPAMTRVWTGGSHACALEKTGGLVCWGANEEGQLGDGTFVARPFATRLPWKDRPTELALGASHSCGLFDGHVRCWGRGAKSVPSGLPAAHATASVEPLAIAMESGPLPPASALAATPSATCAITTEGTFCWPVHGVSNVARSAGFLRGARVRLLAGGGFFCAALDEPRAVRCDDGGDGQGERGSDVLVGADVVSLTTGKSHACAVLSDGTVTCWGSNDQGQLGDGTKNPSRAPVVVHGIGGAVSVHAGNKHTCARLRNNTVWCWGDNRVAQLANGTNEASPVPVALHGLVGVAELAVAGDSACVRLSDGYVRCWGRNDVGQLGDGSTFDNSVPMPIRFTSTDLPKP